MIGQIVRIITAFKPKNENIRHFAKTILIWRIIDVVLSVAAYFVFWRISGLLMDYINQAAHGTLSGWKDIFSHPDQFKNGDFGKYKT